MYDALKSIIAISQQRVIDPIPDELFLSNINFFVKAYLINICTYLESYLQEVAFQLAKRINEKIVSASIPQNYVHWRLATKNFKDENFNYSYLELAVDAKTISANLSANIYKTIELFRNLGVDLTASADFQACKGLISPVVTKRNNIIHHNDNASDVTFHDLLAHIDNFILYLSAINAVVPEN